MNRLLLAALLLGSLCGCCTICRVLTGEEGQPSPGQAFAQGLRPTAPPAQPAPAAAAR